MKSGRLSGVRSRPSLLSTTFVRLQLYAVYYLLHSEWMCHLSWWHIHSIHLTSSYDNIETPLSMSDAIQQMMCPPRWTQNHRPFSISRLIVSRSGCACGSWCYISRYQQEEQNEDDKEYNCPLCISAECTHVYLSFSINVDTLHPTHKRKSLTPANAWSENIYIPNAWTSCGVPHTFPFSKSRLPLTLFCWCVAEDNKTLPRQNES